jgi:DNA-binding transcriptional MerR regulator
MDRIEDGEAAMLDPGVRSKVKLLQGPAMRIGQLATATGLSRDALRFYEKRGLLTARRSGNGYRDYPPEAAQWLRYIRTAQSLGFTLGEIEADLPLLSGQPASAPALRDALRRKLQDIDRRVDGLLALRGELARRLDEGMADCPLQPASISSIAT